MTGSYNRFFRSYETQGKGEVLLHANRVQPKPKKTPILGRKKKEEINPDTLDFTKKVLHLAYHPFLNLMAVTAHNNLFIFTA